MNSHYLCFLQYYTARLLFSEEILRCVGWNINLWVYFWFCQTKFANNETHFLLYTLIQAYGVGEFQGWSIVWVAQASVRKPKWRWCKLFRKLRICMQTPLQLDIWLQSYEGFDHPKNNIKQRNLNTAVPDISKTIFATSDSFPLIMSHIK